MRKITEVKINNNINILGMMVFTSFLDLETVYIPSTVNSIGQFVFDWLESFTCEMYFQIQLYQ